MGRSTIPASLRAAAGFLGLGLLHLAGCAAAPENGIQRAERNRREDALRVEREGLDRERRLLALSLEEDRAAILPLRAAAADAAQRRRDAVRSLAHEEAQLRVQEEALAAARARVASVQQQVDTLRTALAEVETVELRLAALKQRSAQLDAELAAAQRDVDQAVAAMQPKVDALRARLAALGAVAAQIDALLPPPAAAPAANPK